MPGVSRARYRLQGVVVAVLEALRAQVNGWVSLGSPNNGAVLADVAFVLGVPTEMRGEQFAVRAPPPHPGYGGLEPPNGGNHPWRNRDHAAFYRGRKHRRGRVVPTVKRHQPAVPAVTMCVKIEVRTAGFEPTWASLGGIQGLAPGGFRVPRCVCQFHHVRVNQPSRIS